jgi:hypothetical protein
MGAMMQPDDQFLNVRYQEPKPEFAAALYQQLSQPTPKKRHAERLLRGVAYSGIAALIVVGLMWLALPEVRAQVNRYVQNFITLYFGDVQLFVQRSDTITASTNEYAFQSGHVETTSMSISDAQALLPFDVPTWAPEGFVLADTVKVSIYSFRDTMIALTWKREEDAIALTILDNPTPEIPVGSSVSSRSVTVNDTEAVIFTGSWIQEGDSMRWGGEQISLVLSRDNVAYWLTSESVSEEDLIRMAESLE